MPNPKFSDQNWTRRLCAPWQTELDAADALLAAVGRLGRAWSTHETRRLWTETSLVDLRGRVASIDAAATGPLPFGAGDCCAPKLLVAAARAGIRPEGLCEVWWGGEGPFAPGQVVGACAARCRPLLGYLLCGADG